MTFQSKIASSSCLPSKIFHVPQLTFRAFAAGRGPVFRPASEALRIEWNPVKSGRTRSPTLEIHPDLDATLSRRASGPQRGRR